MRLRLGLAALAMAIGILAASPKPTITSLSPVYSVAGQAAPLLTINGSGFRNSSQMQLFVGTSQRTFTYNGSTQIKTQLTAADVAAPAFWGIYVTEKTGTSNATSFQVCAPIVITTTTLPAGQQFVAYSTQLQAVGGCK